MNNSTNKPNAIPEENAEHPQTVMKNNSLPEGWSKVQMTKHPKIVWYEDESGHSQWYPPGAEEVEPVNLQENASLPSKWRKASFKNNVDPKQYWYESLNGETSWEKPQGPIMPTKNNTPKNTSVNKFKNVFNKLNTIKGTLNNLSNKLKGGRKYKTRKNRKSSRARR